MKKPVAKKPAAKPVAKKKPATKRPVQTEAAAAVKPIRKVPDDPETPPTLTGTLSMATGVPTLQTKAGAFQIVNVNDWADSIHTFGGEDVQAFAGRTVTVRGWPEDGWLPGQTGTPRLAVEEWAPGNTPDFVSGRLQVIGNDVFVRVREDKKVKVVDTKLADALRGFDRLSVVLPGEVEKKGDAWAFKGAPADFYILGGFLGAYGAAPVGDSVTFQLQLAHGMSHPAKLPTASWDAVPRGQRHYLFGHFENGQFEGRGFTPSAGPWSQSSGVIATPNAAFRSAAEKANAAPAVAGGFEL